MRILKLDALNTSPMVATIYSKNSKVYYNIKHGDTGYESKPLSYGIDKKILDPKLNKNEPFILLNKSNYTIKPIYKKNIGKVQDTNGNDIYLVSADNNNSHVEDILLFWEIPNKNYKNVIYTLNGDCTKLGQSITKKERGNDTFITPAPVIEIFGECVLMWSGDSQDNKNVSQVIKIYKENDKLIFNIEPIKTTNKGLNNE